MPRQEDLVGQLGRYVAVVCVDGLAIENAAPFRSQAIRLSRRSSADQTGRHAAQAAARGGGGIGICLSGEAVQQQEQRAA